jgi:hypothetical protein
MFTRALIILALALAASGTSAFESKQGGFSAAFPGEPKIEDKTSARGTERWHVLIKDGHSFIVVYYEPIDKLKALPVKELMDAEEKGLLKEGAVVRKQDFMLAGNPAREIESKTTDGIAIVSRVVVTRQRVYELLTATRASSPTPQQKAFITSFALTVQ